MWELGPESVPRNGTQRPRSPLCSSHFLRAKQEEADLFEISNKVTAPPVDEEAAGDPVATAQDLKGDSLPVKNHPFS